MDSVPQFGRDSLLLGLGAAVIGYRAVLAEPDIELTRYGRARRALWQHLTEVQRLQYVQYKAFVVDAADGTAWLVGLGRPRGNLHLVKVPPGFWRFPLGAVCCATSRNGALPLPDIYLALKRYLEVDPVYVYTHCAHLVEPRHRLHNRLTTFWRGHALDYDRELQRFGQPPEQAPDGSSVSLWLR